MKALLPTLSLVTIVYSASAQVPTLVKDIRPGSSASSPRSLTNINGTLFFIGNDGVHEPELWKSNGTEAGTVLVKDINPGAITSFDLYPWFTKVDSVLFFVAATPDEGFELHKSDGTDTGTVLVKDIMPGQNPSGTSRLVNVNGTLFFGADNGVNGYELWKSDGTESGTVMVKDIVPGAGSSYVYELTNVNGVLFFAASSTSAGKELWRSDGTPGGTYMIKDIFPGSSNSDPGYLVNIDGILYFQANDGVNGSELWKSDGTSAGTVMVKNIAAGSAGSFPHNITIVNGTIFFAAQTAAYGLELYKSDGTGAGTVLVKDIYPGLYDSFPGYFTAYNGELYFQAYDGVNGTELWKSNGTASGTLMVKNIFSGSGSSDPAHLEVAGGLLYFSASDGALHGHELWSSDGTEAGTIMVYDINSAPFGTISSAPSEMTLLNNMLIFSAFTQDIGRELRKICVNIPEPIITASPAASMCAGDSVLLSVQAGQGWTYQWLKDSTQLTGASFDNYYASSPGSYSIRTDSSGCAFISSPITVIVNTPTAPSITQNGNLLTCTVTASAYQWYLDGNAISGANGSTYAITQDGNYAVAITDTNNCAAISAPYGATVTGTGELLNRPSDLLIYPNPASDVVDVSWTTGEQFHSFTLTDVNGRIILSGNVNTGNSLRLDLGALPTALYFLELQNESLKVRRKISKN